MPATVVCPICKKEVLLDAPEMPFCSKRCRLLDLGNWASEKYTVSTPAPQLSDVEDTGEPEGPDR